MQAKLIITFEALGDAALLSKAELISNSMATNINFPSPWPFPLSNPTTLTSAFTAYQTAYNNASTHDDVKIALRNTARTALITYLKKLAPYLEVLANGDVAKLLTSGFSLRKDSVPTGGTNPPPVPTNFTVERGAAGQLIAKAKKLRNVSAYELQINSGDPSNEAGWHSLPIVTSCTKVKIDGLTPLTKVWVRLRAINSNGSGGWTDPACSVVL